MKRKRFPALFLTLALCLSLLTLPAHAQDFTDVPTNFWNGAGYEYIHRMFEAGLARGYEDGTFKPNAKMTAAETLLFCARATGVDKAVQARVSAARKEQMDSILPTSNSLATWAGPELAVAVETGVLSLEELTALAQTDPNSARTAADGSTTYRTYLEETMPREDIAMYLVRAMQLEPLARSMTNFPMSYPDADQISPDRQPYVYILTMYGIVNGKGTGLEPAVFEPKSSVTRAEMTTMLCRALDFMEGMGIVTELSEYTTYSWAAGTITNKATTADGSTVLTITDRLSDQQSSYTLPVSAKIYSDNMLTSASALKPGLYARLNFSDQGAIQEVRLSGALTEYTGDLLSLNGDDLKLNANGTYLNFRLTRFTKVSLRQQVGDRSLLSDGVTDYSTATCFVDETGALVAVRFAGGSQLKSGILESVKVIGDVTTLGLAAPNGAVSYYTLPASATTTVDNLPGSITAENVGHGVELRLASETNQVTAANLLGDTVYVQGPITRQGNMVGTAWSVAIKDRFTNAEVTYPVSSSTAIQYDGVKKTTSQIEVGWYVTAVAVKRVFTQIDGFPAHNTISGVISAIEFGDTVALRVAQPDGSEYRAEMKLDQLPTITLDGVEVGVAGIHAGDSVTVVNRYNVIDKVEAKSRPADLTGTVDSVTQSGDGVIFVVRLPDGAKNTYTAENGVTVTRGSIPASIYSLKWGDQVSLTIDGNKVRSVDIAISSADTEGFSITGTVIQLGSLNGDQTVTLFTENGLAVAVLKNTKLMNNKMEEVNLTLGLSIGDKLSIFGKYVGGHFQASVIIKQ